MRLFLFLSSISFGQNEIGQPFHEGGRGPDKPYSGRAQFHSQGMLELTITYSPELIVTFSGILQAGY